MVTFSPDLEAVAQAAAEQLVLKLTGAPPSAAFDPQKEAAEDLPQVVPSAQLPGGKVQAQQLLETAHALAPQNREYAAQVAFVAFSARLAAGELALAGAELDELERCLNAEVEAGDVGHWRPGPWSRTR